MNPGAASVARISVSLSKEEVAVLRKAAARLGRSVSELVRTVIRTIVLKQRLPDFVDIWNGELKQTSVEHDSVYDEL
jgi:ribbon-helix-helix CopG family protein